MSCVTENTLERKYVKRNAVKRKYVKNVILYSVFTRYSLRLTLPRFYSGFYRPRFQFFLSLSHSGRFRCDHTGLNLKLAECWSARFFSLSVPRSMSAIPSPERSAVNVLSRVEAIFS